MRPVAWLFTFGVLSLAEDLPREATALLRERCQGCHAGKRAASRLDLTTRKGLLAGGERGPAIIPALPDDSLLFRLATHQETPHMPPTGKLADAESAILRRWILAGAPWPEDIRESAVAARPAPIKHWAFAPPSRSSAHRSIDAFLAASRAKHELTPAGRADPRTLVRRAYLNVLGLPPPVAEVRAFAADPSDEAWEGLVDRLLASPHFGERMARRWLDLVRYADSGGYEFDADRPDAWRYRDWVVRAFNADMPYDRFARLQIAGDELEPESPDAHIATGFLCLGPETNIKNELTRMDELDDIVSTTSLAFQGLTLGCARCHDHRYDPISQRDYYGVQAVFFSTKTVEHPLAPVREVELAREANRRMDAEARPLLERKTAIERPYRAEIFEERVARLAKHLREAWRTPPGKRTEGQRLSARQIEKTVEISEPHVAGRMNAADRKEHEGLNAALAALERRRPTRLPSAMTIGEEGREALPSYLLHRGNPDDKGPLAAPGVFSAIDWSGFRAGPAPPEARSSHRRRAFAEWLASPRNPLTARVMANRLWQWTFGEGLVATPNDFGRKGAPPSHPELLDWLAVEFMERGWSAKTLLRLMLTSEAFRMSAGSVEAGRLRDPENRYLWRARTPRLDAETLRDSMLGAAGMLGPAVGGQPVFPRIDPSLFQKSSQRNWPGHADTDPATWRRSLYVFNKRSIRYPLFEAFDGPGMITPCARRTVSVTAPQALLLMNNAAVRLQAEQFAARLMREAGARRDRIGLGFEIAFGREPAAGELEAAERFLAGGAELAEFCQALFNANEFVFAP